MKGPFGRNEFCSEYVPLKMSSKGAASAVGVDIARWVTSATRAKKY